MSQRNIRRVRIRLAASFLAVWAAVTVILFWVDKPESLFGLSSRGGYLDGSGDFSWELLRPTAKLDWVDCYSSFQCARLKVPLNYSDPAGETAAIAVIRLPSILANSSAYRGPILINPGGPGGSGVDTVKTTGNLLSEIVGPQFDVVGFDPRGIGRSTPRVSFFESPAERELWQSEALTFTLNATADGVARDWARSQVTGRLAGERDHGVLSHINTDHTARDMLRITEAHGREKMQYWGFSYGTVLGATFAAMFPDKIERLIIDGVVDTENYYATLWSNNLLDADKNWATFFDGCAAAGPDGCAFYAPSAEAIRQNLSALYESVRARPVPVRTSTSYGLVDYSSVRGAIFRSLYRPHTMFVLLAEALANLAAGDGEAMFKLGQQPVFHCSCDPSETMFEVVRDASTAILCNDGAPVPSSFEEAEAHYARLQKVSSFADLWASLRTSCSGWPQLPKTHFQGPFVGNTSFPLLLIGNDADPVTPLWAAKKVSKGFPGSVVLTQNSVGHCSIAAPSLCTSKYIREYFVNGTLPKPGTWCEVDSTPFPAAARMQPVEQATLGSSEILSSDDYHLLEATKALSRSFNIGMPFFPL